MFKLVRVQANALEQHFMKFYTGMDVGAKIKRSKTVRLDPAQKGVLI